MGDGGATLTVVCSEEVMGKRKKEKKRDKEKKRKRVEKSSEKDCNDPEYVSSPPSGVCAQHIVSFYPSAATGVGFVLMLYLCCVIIFYAFVANLLPDNLLPNKLLTFSLMHGRLLHSILIDLILLYVFGVNVQPIIFHSILIDIILFLDNNERILIPVAVNFGVTKTSFGEGTASTLNLAVFTFHYGNMGLVKYSFFRSL